LSTSVLRINDIDDEDVDGGGGDDRDTSILEKLLEGRLDETQ